MLSRSADRLIAPFILTFIACASPDSPQTKQTATEAVVFEFAHESRGETFFAQTSNPAVIAAVRNELSKPPNQRTLHINGALARGSAQINEPWSWHFVSDQWSLAELSIELCDSWPSYVEEHLDEWLADVGSFCPWGSRVVGERNGIVTTAPIPGSDSAPRSLETNVSQADFNAIIGRIMDIYSPIAAEKGAQLFLCAPGDPEKRDCQQSNDTTEENASRKLVLEKMWELAAPNAHATKNTRTNTWYLTVNGELARQPEISNESLALIACHEIGHHFGGFPLYLISPFTGTYAIPLSAEGQADYYAAQVCAKRMWQGMDNSADASGTPYKSLAGANSARGCDAEYTAREDRELCYKIAYAGTQAATLWHRFKPTGADPPSTDRPDSTRVPETNQKYYPPPQSRLDTYFAGARCPTEVDEASAVHDKIIYDLRNIPGIDHPNGPDSRDARDASRLLTCGPSLPNGARPRSWFDPEYYSDSPYSPF